MLFRSAAAASALGLVEELNGEYVLYVGCIPQATSNTSTTMVVDPNQIAFGRIVEPGSLTIVRGALWGRLSKNGRSRLGSCCLLPSFTARLRRLITSLFRPQAQPPQPFMPQPLRPSGWWRS